MTPVNLGRTCLVTTVALAIALTLTLPGCGSSTEHKLQRAQLALSGGKPDEAARQADDILASEPGNIPAMAVKAQALIQLASFDESRRLLDELARREPAEVAHRRLMMQWAFRKMESLYRRSDFVGSEEVQRAYDQALAYGQDQAQWYAEVDKNLAEASYQRARLGEADLARMATRYESIRSSLASVQEPGVVTDTQRAMERLKADMDAADLKVQQMLEEAVAADPAHMDATQMFVRVLGRRTEWAKLWALAQKVSQVEKLPTGLAADAVVGLIQIPEGVATLTDRTALGWKLLERVDGPGRETLEWRLSGARLHLRRNEYEPAVKLLDKAIKQAPADRDARYMISYSHYGLKQYGEARKVLDRLITEMPQNPDVNRLYGLVLMELGDMALAREHLRRAIDADANDILSAQAFLELLTRQNQLTQARGEVDRAYRDNPTDPRVVRFKLRYEIAQGSPTDVASVMAKLEQVDPLTDEHLILLIEGYSYLQNGDKVYRYARALADHRPDMLDAQLQVVQALILQRKDAEARTLLLALREKFPDQAPVDQSLARLYIARQLYDKAVALLEPIVRDQPQDIPIRLLLSQAYAGLSMVDEALGQVNAVLDIEPRNAQAHGIASRIYEVQGQRDKADFHLQQIDESTIDEKKTPALLAQLKLRKGQPDEAQAICLRALEAGNPDPVVRLLLAGIYLQRGESDSAEFHLTALVRSRPNDPTAYSLLTRFLLEKRDVNKALNELSNLQKQNEVLARLSKAEVLRSVSRLDDAARELEEIYIPAIQQQSRMSLRVADALAQLYRQQGKTPKAIAAYEPLIKAGLSSQEATLRQIDLTMSSGPLSDAARTDLLGRLDRLRAQLATAMPRLRYDLIRRYAALGKPDLAMSLLDEWIQQTPEKSRAALYRWKGDLYRELRQPDRAIETYRQSIALSADNPVGYLQLANLHVLYGNYPAAESVFRDMAKLDAGSRITALGALGEMFSSLGLTRAAAATFQELEAGAKPTDPRVLFASGIAAQVREDLNTAVQRFQAIPAYSGLYAPAQVRLAHVEQVQGKSDEARKRLEALVRDARYAASAAVELLRFDVRTGREEQLLQWSDQALAYERMPEDSRRAWLAIRISIADRAKQWALAQDNVDRLITMTPDVSTLQAAHVALLVAQGQPQRALQAFAASKALRQTPTGALLAVAMGGTADDFSRLSPLEHYLVALATGNADQARAIAPSMNNGMAYFPSDLTAILDAGPLTPAVTDAARQLCLSLAALQSGLPGLASHSAEVVANKQPGLVIAYGLIAQGLDAQRKPMVPAVTQLRRALPQSLLARYLAARADLIDGRATDAIPVLEELAAKQPGHVATLFDLSKAYEQADRTEDVVRILRQIIQTDSPQRIAAMNDLAYKLVKLNPQNIEEGSKLAQAAIAATPNSPAVLDTLAYIEHLRGNDKQALDLLVRATPALKDRPELHYHLGLVYRKLGNQTWARYHLEEAAGSTLAVSEVGAAKAALRNSN